MIDQTSRLVEALHRVMISSDSVVGDSGSEFNSDTVDSVARFNSDAVDSGSRFNSDVVDSASNGSFSPVCPHAKSVIA